MATAAMRGGRKPASIRTLWAIAKSPELQLSEEDLHAIVYRETGKESMKKLTQGEINTLARILQNMKDGISLDVHTKRTDEGGDPRTVQLRRKIYALCDTLGWNNDNQRINAFAKRMCGVERIEWLDMAQCSKIVEALKAMAARQEAEKGTE
jgi:Protein of unknown function (DUF1018).